MTAKFEFMYRTGYAGEPEYVLWCSLTEGKLKSRAYMIWDYKPDEDEILDQIQFALRCFDLYHSSMNKPDYLAEFYSIEGLNDKTEVRNVSKI
jgi:hypothetical protein